MASPNYSYPEKQKIEIEVTVFGDQDRYPRGGGGGEHSGVKVTGMIKRTQKSIPPQKNSLGPQTNFFFRIFPSGNELSFPKKSKMRGWKFNAMPSGLSISYFFFLMPQAAQ